MYAQWLSVLSMGEAVVYDDDKNLALMLLTVVSEKPELTDRPTDRLARMPSANDSISASRLPEYRHTMPHKLFILYQRLTYLRR